MQFEMESFLRQAREKLAAGADLEVLWLKLQSVEDRIAGRLEEVRTRPRLTPIERIGENQAIFVDQLQAALARGFLTALERDDRALEELTTKAANDGWAALNAMTDAVAVPDPDAYQQAMRRLIEAVATIPHR